MRVLLFYCLRNYSSLFIRETKNGWVIFRINLPEEKEKTLCYNTPMKKQKENKIKRGEAHHRVAPRLGAKQKNEGIKEAKKKKK